MNTVSEGLNVSEKNSIGVWRKDKKEENLITLSPVVLWKIENISNTLIDLAKDISLQNVEGTSFCFNHV